ncbi:MAG TPA: HAMP domain-containing sensor histidine kinase, partial [Vicinamibacterales bacterium]|nr:HAMP domain-containing sensor histidine kinase [Vicinamibacterales bacterium]
VNMLMNARHAVNGDNAPGPKGPGLQGADVGRVLLDPPVILKATAAGDRVTIAIIDRGAGVAPADVAHIFDPYFTTKRGGTGLGLPIARNIVEGLGGTITVLSSIDARGHGTEIRIDLPALSIPSGSRASGAA